MAPGVIRSCTQCQKQHTKCDSVRPTCGACVRLDRLCQWANVTRFRHDLNPSIQTSVDGNWIGFLDEQEWVGIPRNLRFLDETRELEMIYSDISILDSSRQYTEDESKSTSIQSDIASEISESNVKSIPTHLSRAFLGSASSEHPRLPETSINSIAHNRSTVSRHDILRPLREQKANSLKLQDELEARLMAHFVDKLSPWFDCCDFNKHFATVVPRCAMFQPTLLNAICAVSARHLSRTGDCESVTADHFYQSCLSTLIPALHNPDVLKDETLFAATVILRLFEELNEQPTGSGDLSHLLGIRVFLDAQDYTTVPCGLGQATFWVAMRQELGMSFNHQRPVLSSLMQHHTSLNFEPASESVWGYRSAIFLALVLEFCYGSEGKSVENWQELADYHRKWLEFRPEVFEPIYYKDSQNDAFPSIYYLGSVHIVTANNHTMAWILLTAHDPHGSSTEENKGEGDSIDKEIKRHIRELCGTALSNCHILTAMLSACGGITVFANRYSEYDEQVLLLSILIETEKQHGWGTTAARRKLMDLWGWKL